MSNESLCRPLFSHKSIFIGQCDKINDEAIRTMLHVGVPPFPESPWHGVRCLEPGRTNDGLDFSGTTQPCLETAIRKAIVAACPAREASISFSGGVDSTLIAAIAKSEGIAIDAVCMRFHSDDPDAENAINIARELEIDLTIIDFDVDEALETLHTVAKCQLPTCDSSALPTFVVAKHASCGTMLDGIGADALYASKSWIDRFRQLSRLPRLFRRLGSVPFHILWKSNERVCQFRKLDNDSIAIMQLANSYGGKTYARPKSLAFIDKWFTEAENQLGTSSALIAQSVAFRSMGVLAQKYTALELRAGFPIVESADLTGQYLHESEPKKVLKDMLCQFVPREYVYRRKYGFSMNQRFVLTQPSFISAFRESLETTNFAKNGKWLLQALEENKSLPWYLYNSIWSLTVLGIWLQQAAQSSDAVSSSN